MEKPSPARCPTCGSQELLTVIMRPHGDSISFTSCNACGWRRWGRGKEVVLLSSVRPLFGKKPEESPEQRTPDVVKLPARGRGGATARPRQTRRTLRDEGPVVRDLKSLRRR
jgi:Zn ribbon nucleic-acid-binding protein